MAPRSGPAGTWNAILLGAATGFLAAAVGIGLWTWVRSRRDDAPPAHETAQIELFRLASGGAREAFLVRAGPDALGEDRLAAALFPDARRELVSLLLANVSPQEAWDVDLAAQPLRCRAEGGGWEEIGRLDGALPRLAPSDDVRLRALGARETHVRVEPGSLRQVLLALPPGRKLGALTDVQWGDAPLVRDRLELARLRRFREDPAGTTTGR